MITRIQPLLVGPLVRVDGLDDVDEVVAQRSTADEDEEAGRHKNLEPAPRDAVTVQTKHAEVAHALRLERQLLEGRRCRPDGGGGTQEAKEQKPT